MEARLQSMIAKTMEVLTMKASRNWVDPFDEMSDDDFYAQVDRLFSARSGSVAVSPRTCWTA